MYTKAKTLEMLQTLYPTLETLDFPYLDFKEEFGRNELIAEKLALMLLDQVDIDDFFDQPEMEGKSWQRFSLAKLFIRYSSLRSNRCPISLFQHQCLVELLDDLEVELELLNENRHRMKKLNNNIKLLKDVINTFEREFAKEHPEFLFTLLKR